MGGIVNPRPIGELLSISAEVWLSSNKKVDVRALYSSLEILKIFYPWNKL
jgi:hypothetical protein